MKGLRMHKEDIVSGLKVASLILAGVLAAGASPGWAGERNAGRSEVRTATFALG
jgi:hypothetical protein